MTMRKIFAISTTLLILAACARGTEDFGGGGPQHAMQDTQSDDNANVPSFAEVYASVIKERCATCHSVAQGNKHGVNLETYQNIKDKAQKIVNTVENADPKIMPPRKAPPLTAAQKAMLLKWIRAGLPLDSAANRDDAAQ